MNLNDYNIQRNMIFDDFHDFCSIPVLELIFDEFRHRFRLHVESLLVFISYVSPSFFYVFSIIILMEF